MTRFIHYLSDPQRMLSRELNYDIDPQVSLRMGRNQL